ncbi:MAG: hypothetical protein IPK32_09595 [Verrucomicrobiaceae bacterium]|nr:hypothetical protein [Verrucomicrobiaceae bacterium]
MFTTAFAAGWVVGVVRLKRGQDEAHGAMWSQASIAGFLTAFVACFAAYTASDIPLAVVAPFFGLGLLPSALFATIGASTAQRAGMREGRMALVLSAVLPAVAVFVWPVVYAAGKFTEKPPVVIPPGPAPVVVSEPPKPRYEKPPGFDDSHAWKRSVVSQEVIRNADHKSVRVLSRDERRLAFVTHNGDDYHLAVRHLYDPGPDYAIQTQGGISALAWSPDDRRIIFLAANTGLFWVCEPVAGKMVQLPIPKVATDTVAGLAWWKEEDVVVTLRSGETQMLSLATLRLKSASENEAWAKLTEAERTTVLRRQTLRPNGKVGYEIRFDGPKTSVAAQDFETAYEQVLIADLARSGDAFANRDGSILFLSEEARLRVLYMDLRAAPTLRFIGEATEDFPTGDAVSAALAKRAIRAVVAAPIVNPLNGKTVAGDPTNIRGYARFTAASGKTCSVWIENELQPIREGDVLISLSAIQDGREFSVSPSWWAVLTKADNNQSIPRRADVPVSLPSPSRELPPLPKPIPSTLVVPKPADQRSAPNPAPTPTVVTPPAVQPAAPNPKDSSPNTSAAMPAVAPKTEPAAAPTQKRLPTIGAADVKEFVIGLHESYSRKELTATSRGYADTFEFEGHTINRDKYLDMLRNSWSQSDSVTEVALEPIRVTSLGGGKFSVTYRTVRTYRKAGFAPKIAKAGWEIEIHQEPEGLRIVRQTFIEPDRLGGAAR